MLRPYNGNQHVSPFDVLSCVDYGDVAIVPGYTQRSYDAIEADLSPIVEAGVIPLAIGGDHACTLPHLRATRSRTRRGDRLHSDTDAWNDYFGEKYNHGTWMRRAIEEGLVDVAHSIEVGLRGPIYGPDRLAEPALGAWPRLPDHRGHLHHRPGGRGREDPRAGGRRPAFISFDIDVVDPAMRPAPDPRAGRPPRRTTC